MAHSGRFASGVIGVRNGGGGSSPIFVQQLRAQNFDSNPTPSTFYKEFAAHFNDGDVPAGKIVEWRRSDGTTVIASQADNFKYWPGGALKDASFTAKFTSSYAASATDTLKAYSKTGTWNNSSHGTISLLTARDIRLEVTIDGTIYTLAVNNEITRNTNVTQTRAGPWHCQWRIFGELRNGTAINSTAQGSFWGRIYLTFFDDGTRAVYAEVKPNRSTDSSAGTHTITDYKVKDYIGPTTLFDYSTSFTSYAGSPFVTVNTDGIHPYTGTNVDKFVIAPPLHVLSDSTTTGWYDSCAINWYKWTSAQIALINSATSSTYTPNTVADSGDLNGTGAHQWLGPMGYWAVSAMLTGTWASLRADRINAFAFLSILADWEDAVTGHPANLSSNTYPGLAASTPSIGWGSGATITVSGGFPPGASSGTDPRDWSHAPLFAWYQYLATGQEWWLDMMYSQCIGFLGYGIPSYFGIGGRAPTINGHSYVGIYQLQTQTRALGWSLRGIDDTAWVSPTNHVMTPYVKALANNQMTAMNDFMDFPTTPTLNPLGVFWGGGQIETCTTSGWMHDYLGLILIMRVRRSLTQATENLIAKHLTNWIIGRAYTGCPYSATSYRIGFGQGQTPTFTGFGSSDAGGPDVYPTAWSQVWIGNGNPLAYSLTTPNGFGSCPASGLNDDIVVNGGDPAAFQFGHHYPNILCCVSGAAKDIGITGAATVHSYYITTETAASITDAARADSPQWWIRPRA